MLKRLRQVGVFLAMYATLFFVSAGTVNVPQAWIYFISYLVYAVLLGLAVRNPALFKERSGGSKSLEYGWDKALLAVNALGLVATYVVAGLDIGRYGWSPPPSVPIILTGFVVYYAGGVLVGWAMRANTFFSTVVRIQEERGHRAVTGGPYRYVRHPGYVGMLLMIVAVPFILGSLWSLIPAAIAGGAMVVRTAQEDALLRAQLEGYSDYAAQTKSRLIPGIW
jgi:protein-S-isoprenylcysteine O-methyltransferase Ste14